MRWVASLALLVLVSGCGGDAEREHRAAAAGPDPHLADWLHVSDPVRGERLVHRFAACHAARHV